MMHKITKVYWENTEINGEANCISAYEDNNVQNISDVPNFHYSFDIISVKAST